MNYAEEQMKHAEEIKRSFNKVEDIFWPLHVEKLENSDDGGIKIKCSRNDGGQEEKEDVVNHPSHYAESCSIECIDAMECMFGTDKLISFCFMNAFKYIWRFKNKNGLEDLKKARWYMLKAYETTHSESRHVNDTCGEDFVDWVDETYLRLNTLITEAGLKGGFHGV